MISRPDIISDLYNKMFGDSRLTVWHISLYATLLILWQQTNFKTQVRVSRKMLMAKAHFRSITTYHKCITQLKDFGYIIYHPTYDCYEGTVIQIIVNRI
jgi:hypothetical protein